MNDEQPTHLDLCSGLGGFAIAASWAGFHTVAFSEVDPFCCRLLAERFPGIPNIGDIRSIPKTDCTVLTAGFPCQPFSNCGLKRDQDDHRDLWPSVLRAIDLCQPAWVLAENVVGIKRMVLTRCLNGLEERGYQCSALDIPSCSVGLQSVERHIWIVAARDGIRGQWFNETEFPGQPRSRQQAKTHGRIAYVRPGQPLPSSRFWRGTKGASNRLDRIRAIGNAIPPAVAFQILKTIRQLIPNETPTTS